MPDTRQFPSQMKKPVLSERIPQKRRNRRRRRWDDLVRRVCCVIFCVELLLLIFANPHLQVSKVQIDGLQTLSTPQVFNEAQVPARTNIFWMAVHNQFRQRLAQNPVIDHVSQTIALPHTLVLHVRERQPYAALEVADANAGNQYWVLDKNQVPFEVWSHPSSKVPVLQWSGASAPALALGHKIDDPRVTSAYTLLSLLRRAPSLAVGKIEVDQNANLCLNNRDGLEIKLGQPDALSQKIALAQATLSVDNGAFAHQVACLDLSCPQQPVYIPRTAIADLVAESGMKNGNRPNVNDQ